MRFVEIIQSAAHSTAIQTNIITDGEHSCSYQEIPSVLEQIHEFITAQGVTVGDSIAYECVSTVSGALALLYLMAYDHNFVLLPPSDDSKHQNSAENKLDLKPVPHFCQHRITINHGSSVGIQSPESFLQVMPNSLYNGLRAVGIHSEKDGIIYLCTSGSMGISKITVHTNEKLLRNALNCVERFELESSDRVAIPVPIFHMYGLGAGFLPAIAAGASIDLQQNSNILRYLDRERKFNPNVAYLTPTLCDMLVSGRKNPRPYKRVVTATQRIKEDTFYKFDSQFGGLINLYGSTELGAIATSIPTDSVELRATTIKPMPNVRLNVKEDGSTEPDIEADVLRCQHSCGFTGYVDESGAWIQRLTADEWYETGDIAQELASGSFQIVGRAKNSVNRSGYLVFFADIERAMESMDGIEQVVVVAARGESSQGQRIAAFCILTLQGQLDGSQIRNRCLDILPKYAVPDEIYLMGAFPALPNGKVDRQALMVTVD